MVLQMDRRRFWRSSATDSIAEFILMIIRPLLARDHDLTHVVLAKQEMIALERR